MNREILHLTHDEEIYYNLKKDYNILHIQTPKDYVSKEVRDADKVILIDKPLNGILTREKIAYKIGIEKSYVAEYDPTIYDLVDVRPIPVKGIYTIEDSLDDLRKAQKGETKYGYSTGWPQFDHNYKIRRGELSVVTGYPGSGKSEFIDSLCLNLMEKELWRIAFCSFENDRVEHLKKFIQKITGKDFKDANISNLKKYCRHLYLLKDEEDGMTIDKILNHAVICIRRYGIEGLVIDPYNWIEHQRKSSMSETEYVSEILTKVQRFAQHWNIHVWFIAHPTKPPIGKLTAPTLYNISGSAHWANKADVGISVHRKQYSDGSKSHIMKITITKVRYRDSGTEGSVCLIYNFNNHRLEYSEHED